MSPQPRVCFAKRPPLHDAIPCRSLGALYKKFVWPMRYAASTIKRTLAMESSLGRHRRRKDPFV